ncbi:MAG TPA: ABC transporter C-terminal domain-containing protein [Thermoanaerobaculia bacterium]|jgi:hypothetical protein|nr:ABC transporter C-terminal domain-containing protein [Thermoanaerobaculia bacterium]
MRFRILALLVLFLLPLAVFAQSAENNRADQLEREIEKLRAEIAAMKNEGTGDDRITELERRLEVIAAEIERLKIGEAANTADESEYGLGPAASKIYRAERGSSVGGYGELLYQSPEDGEAEFDLLRAVLYFGYKFNDRWLFNSEIEYEHAGEEVGVEFAYLDYLWRPQANLRAGLLLVPMGFINELHEPTTFLGANRPNVERLIIPTTWRENGFGLFGEAGQLSYRTYVVAGLDASGFTAGGIRGGRQEGIESSAEDLAWVGRLDFTGLPGLLVGGSAYVGDSGQGSDLGVGTQILEGHLEWKWRGLELRALAVQAELDDVAALNRELDLRGNRSVGERLTGQYLQVGYDVLAALFPNTGGDQAFIPFGRWETYNTQDEVPRGFSANPANDVEILTLGFSYKPIDQIVVKVDHQNFDNEAGTGTDQFNVLLGWIF